MSTHSPEDKDLNPAEVSSTNILTESGKETGDHENEFISEDKSPEQSAASELSHLKASSSNGKEVAEDVEKKTEEELSAEFEGLGLDEEPHDPFVTIYAVESCEDSAKLRYNPDTQEFDLPEYRKYLEKVFAETLYSPSDSSEQIDLKLKKLREYNEKSEEIAHKKDLIRKWIAVHYSPFWMALFPDEKELCQKFSYYLRVQSVDKHIEMLEHLVFERRSRKCVQIVQEARAFGCATKGDIYSYVEMKRPKSSPQSWMPSAYNFLTDSDIEMCKEFGLELSDFMEKQVYIQKWIRSGEIKKKSDVHLMGLDMKPNHIEQLYDMVMNEVIAAEDGMVP